MRRVFFSEPRKIGSAKTRRQFSRVQAFAMWKKPNRDIKVPSSRKTMGTAVMHRATNATKAKAGRRHGPK